jgi:hypothetical protein
MAARKKSVSRKSATRKAAKTSKPQRGKKKVVAKSRKAPTAKRKITKRKIAPKTPASQRKLPVAEVANPAVAELDNRVAILRANLRDLVEQAASSAGAASEELMSQRIADHEEKLRLLNQERDALLRRRR